MEFSPSNKMKVLIVDDEYDFCEISSELISMQPDMECVGVVHNGRQAVVEISRTQPDVVLLDIVMPEMDGLAVLEHFVEHPLAKRTRFIVSTTIRQQMVMREALRCGADYYMVKPFEPPVLLRRIRMAANCNDSLVLTTPAKRSLEEVVNDQVIHIGVPMNLLGFEYIQEAVVILIRATASEGRPIFKQIYNVIAEHHSTDWRCVENAISCAMKKAMERNSAGWEELLCDSPLDMKKKAPLSNGRFLSLVAQSVRFKV